MRPVSPVLSKEMVTLARAKGYFFARALLLATLLVTIWMTWSNQTRYWANSGFLDTSRIGHALFGTFAVTQLIAVVILVPVLTAPVIASEKDRNTLGLLLMSNLSGFHILLDKLLSRILLMAILLLSGLPIFLALLAFGGVTPSQIVDFYVSLFATVLFCSGLGLLFSTVLNKMHTALIATYASMAGYLFSAVFLEVKNVFNIEYLLPVVPFVPPSLSNLLSWVAISAVVFLGSVLICRRLLPGMADQKKRNLIKRLFERMNAFFGRINFTGIVLMDENRKLEHNAILWKEAHKHFFSSTTFIIRASYGLLMLSLVVLIVTGGWDGAIDAAVYIGSTLAGIVAIVTASTAFSSEREKRCFEILMASPLTARSIVMAKFAGILKLIAPILAWMAIWIGVLSWIGEPRRYCGWHETSRLLLIFPAVAHLPALIVIGLYSSAKRLKASAAILQSFIICAVWTAITLLPILPDLLGARGWWRGFESEWIFEHLLSMTPVTSLFVFVGRNEPSLVACALVIPCWIWLLATLIRRFDRMVGRQ